MNDPIFMARKLENLIGLAEQAKSDFEKASIYAASTAIVTEFTKHDPDDERPKRFTTYAFEKANGVKWHIRAAIGYDIDNNQSAGAHIGHAYGEASSLITELSRCYHVHGKI